MTTVNDQKKMFYNASRNASKAMLLAQIKTMESKLYKMDADSPEFVELEKAIQKQWECWESM
jgi:hypothetical protein